MNKIMIFTNGCFDILHIGHIKLLEYCKSLGEYLIVGINSDISVSKLKGHDRPINNHIYRAYLLNALKVVDDVVIFSDTGPGDFLRAVRPTIHVKDSKYEKAFIPEIYLSEHLGFELRFFSNIDGISTTNIIERIKGL